MSPRVVFIVAQQNFRDEELLISRAVLQRRGAHVAVASETLRPARGKFGATVLPDLTIQEVAAKNFDAIVFVGGPGVRDYFEKRTVLRRAQQFAQAGKVVAAICSAPAILANAGVLISKRATSFPAEESILKDRGAEYTGLPVEADGTIITAKDVTHSREFAEKIAWMLGT